MTGDCSTRILPRSSRSNGSKRSSRFFRSEESDDLNCLNALNGLNDCLFLPRFPELQDPFLRFLLARSEFRVGIREAILDTGNAALLRHHLAKRDVIAQR